MNEKRKNIIFVLIPIIVGYLLLIGVIIFLLIRLNNGGISSGAVNSGKNTDKQDETQVAETIEDESTDSNDAENANLSSQPDGNVENDANGESNTESNAVENPGAEASDDTDTDSNDTNNSDSSTGSDAASSSDTPGTSSSQDFALRPEITGLSLTGDGYEGTKGTGNFNYGEALQKSILFYELQRSGKLPAETRSNWRGDSCLNDGADNSLDLTGGWFDAGDNVKFNLPMAYTATMLAWSMYEDPDAYEESGQKDFALENIRFVNDYFIKCHPEDEVYYYQVGDPGADHSFWGPAEVVETKMSRPSYKVTAQNPGSCVTGETAAALAAASIIFKDEDKSYSKTLLEHAESLYAFADKYKSDQGYTAANGFYQSHSGYNDELAFAGAWLYLATDDKDYLDKAKKAFASINLNPNWALCWDDVSVGAALLLADITGDKTYTDFIEQHLGFWTTGNNGQKINYSPKGLAFLDNWGSLRYATTTGFVAAVYSESKNCPKDKKDTYWDFAVSQADYALGSSGRSYVCGFGENPPEHPHHRTAQGSYVNDMNTPSEHRHVLVGALVGGPDAGDNYTDTVSDFNKNEVACDYNAGFTGLLAKLYSKYKGQTIINLGAVEEPENEIFSEAMINVNGQDFVEIKAYVYNESAWPARCAKDLELRYFIDLSEVYDAGGSVSDIEVNTNYIQDAQANGLQPFDEENHIYYMSIKFADNAVYPGGQESFKKEVQFRMRNTKGTWDNSNDYSFEGLQNNSLITADKLAVYEEGVLVFGSEPEGN